MTTQTRAPLKAHCACGIKAYRTQAAAERALAKIQALGFRATNPTKVTECSYGMWHLTGARKVDTGPDRNTRGLVIVRDEGRCALCGELVLRCGSYSLHHRKPRRSGGTSDPAINSPANLVLLHGDGTSSCHGWIEGHRTVAEHAGLLVRAGVDPATVPICHHVHGVVLLDDEGTWAPYELGGAA